MQATAASLGLHIRTMCCRSSFPTLNPGLYISRVDVLTVIMRLLVAVPACSARPCMFERVPGRCKKSWLCVALPSIDSRYECRVELKGSHCRNQLLILYYIRVYSILVFSKSIFDSILILFYTNSVLTPFGSILSAFFSLSYSVYSIVLYCNYSITH